MMKTLVQNKFMQQKMWLAENFEKIMVAMFAFFASLACPVGEIMFFAGFMVFVDTFTGIWAAKMRGDKITSRKLGRVVSKLVLYPIAIIVAAWCEKLQPGVPFVESATTLLIVVEGKSMIENLTDILGYNFLRIIKGIITDGYKSAMKEKEQLKKNKDEK